ncbi:PAS domain S-box protein [Streptomyces sp. NPDC097610]|uniref:PAS domain S-box protein n=1 Tax=Streptomyces sp. NPDC097610 TaxID=3157227 RepID=UPI00332FD41E
MSANALVNTAAALAVADSSGRVTCWSAGAQALWGYTLEEIVGSPLGDLFSADGSALLHRAGRPLDAQAQLYALSNDDPSAGFLLMAQRRTGRGTRRADDELTRWLFEQHPSILVIFDLEARC